MSTTLVNALGLATAAEALAAGNNTIAREVQPASIAPPMVQADLGWVAAAGLGMVLGITAAKYGVRAWRFGRNIFPRHSRELLAREGQNMMGESIGITAVIPERFEGRDIREVLARRALILPPVPGPHSHIGVCDVDALRAWADRCHLSLELRRELAQSALLDLRELATDIPRWAHWEVSAINSDRSPTPAEIADRKSRKKIAELTQEQIIKAQAWVAEL